MNLTSLEIFNIIKEWVKESALGNAVSDIYTDHRPEYPSNRSIKGEFIVMNILSNAMGEGQVATVNVNIYVPDLTPRMNAVSQRIPDEVRLSELTRLAYDSLKGYPISERWFFDISSEKIMSERDIPYSFANIKVTLKKF